ncbi:ABC transporter substrate-binding protein [Kitasatospora terrestris]|uniref:Probable sugar-binding periplasmic protein n=1 Tax=Kitasatospora terrestris TaxID=258051 RepID=A0ABP9DVW4_9ACTN
MPISRRSLLLGGGALATLGVVSRCGRATAARAEAAGPAGLLEVATPWSTGPEANGLLALLADFKGRAPNVTFVPAPAGADPAARMAAGNPPDCFLTRGGAELSAYAAAGRLEPLDALYDREGWAERLPDGLLPRLGAGPVRYAVPVGVRRTNLLWSSSAVLDGAGADPAPRTFPALLDALRKVAATGCHGLALGGPECLEQLLETVLLDALGPEAWTALWQDGRGWSAPRVATALRGLDELLGYSNLAHGGPTPGTWADATRLLGSGQAGYQLTGDWAEGMLREVLGLRAFSGYRWVAAPGTGRVYQCRVDAFALPRGVRHRDAALVWLAECGSSDGQLALNGARGAVPARIDLPATARALFGPYPRWSLEEWGVLPPLDSLAHGGLVGPSRRAGIDAALAEYLEQRDPDRLRTALSG